MASPSMTFNAVAGALASGSLAANTSTTFNLDLSTKLEGQVTIENTPGGSVATTRGVRIDVFAGYGPTPTYDTIAIQSYTLPSQTASTKESYTLFLSTGKYQVKLTNLDTTNAVTVAGTLATVDGIA